MPKKHTYEFIKSYIEDQGYTLLSEEYKNTRKKLKIKCTEDHIFYKSFYKFRYSNKGCPHCRKIAYKNQRYIDIKNYIESYNYQLLSNEYKSSMDKLKLKCPKGHIYYTRIGAFVNGRRCTVCSRQKLYFNDIKNYIESYNYQLLLDNYENIHKKLKLKCPYDHTFMMNFNNFKNGQRCPICNSLSKTSKAEKEIQQFVMSIYNGEIKPNDRNTIINPCTGYNLELDVYLPEINKAIEFNGKWWHSSVERIKKDSIKNNQCKQLNIDLLIINEENWNLNKDTCIKTIENFINN